MQPDHGSLWRYRRHSPTPFTYLLPRVYARLTPRDRGGCTLSVDLGVLFSFFHSFRSSQPSGWTLPPPSAARSTPTLLDPNAYR